MTPQESYRLGDPAVEPLPPRERACVETMLRRIAPQAPS